MPAHPPSDCGARRWWLEPELLLLGLLIVVGHLARLGDLTPRGEESRRATVAIDMLRTGDWVVPRQQGEHYFSRPPLQNWLIAGSAWLRGECDIWAARLPSVIATLLTTLLIYGYSRTFLTRLGAFAAAAAYPTMAQVTHLGGLAETEAVFTLFVSGSLLVWHWGYSRGWPAAGTWIFAYALVALGTLTKGPQAPIYFALVVGVYLLLVGDGRRLLTWGHFLGVLTFAVLFGVWFLPYALCMGWEAALSILGDNAAGRFYLESPGAAAQHLILYPLEVFASMLPWSLCLLAFLRRPMRAAIGAAAPQVRFLVICLAVTFPSCWLALGAQARYWMPLFPCCALLIGLVVQRATEAAPDSPLRRWWTWYVTGCGLLLMCIPALALTGGALQNWTGLPLAQSSYPLSLGYALLVAALVALLFQHRLHYSPRQVQLSVVALASCLAMSYSAWYVNILVNRSIDTPGAVVQLKADLPGARLVSFDYVHHLFVYCYDEPIPRLDWPADTAMVPDDLTYFCFNGDPSGPTPLTPPQPLPFPWEPVAVINCDRNLRADPEMVVVVGRRLPEKK